MQKTGLAEFKSATDSMNAFIAYYTDDLLVTRIDLYSDYTKYDVLNTEHCFSAYYKDTNEYYLGDDSYVQKVIKLMNKISIMPGERKQTVDVVDGVVVMELTKTFEERNGNLTNTYMFKQTLLDGELTEEVYMSDDIELKFGKITTSTDLAVKPVNFVVYESYGDVFTNNSSVTSYSTAEYYTEEELRLRYAGKLDHLDDYDMVVCCSLQQAIERLKQLREAVVPRIAVDIESTGLNVGMFGPDCITGVGISFSETQSTYYPFRQEGCDYNLPIWFMSEILEAYNNHESRVKSCTFNGKMEIESFWKERPAFIKYSEYAMSWTYGLYDSTFNEESFYTPNKFEEDFVKHNKFAQHWLNSPETINDGDLMTVFTNDDGLHTSIKLDQRRGRGIHKLKTIAEKITNKFWLELELIFKGEVRFNVLPANLIRLYACPDTMNAIRVCRVLEEQFPSDEMRVLELENELNYVKAQNEFFGLPMDSDRLNSLILEDSYIKDLLEKRFREIHHTSKNIRSNSVKADIFYNRLKAPVLLRTKTGAPSASNAALNAILEDGVIPKDKVNKEHPTPDIAIFIRKDGSVCTYDKLSEEEKAMIESYNSNNVKEKDREISTRVVIKGKKLDENRYPSLIILSEFNKVCKELGALTRLKKKSFNDRFQFYIISDGADSDRQTSDAHQFSDTMKKCVVADSRHHKLISCDYKQVELRILAFLANEKELMESQKDPMVDVHRAIIERIDGTPMWAIAAEVRKLKKAVNFGVVYGMTEYGLVKRLFGIKYTKEELLKAMKMILDFYNGLPGVKAFKLESEQEVMQKGYVTTAFGFRRYFDIVKDPSASKKDIDKAKKAANNTRVQGFGATLLKKAECYYNAYIKEKHWDELVDCDGVMLPKVRMMLSIHDEVLISAHESIPIEEVIEMCKVCQEIPVKGAPPFFAAPAFVNCWYDGKDDAYEIPIPFRDEILDEYKKDGRHLVTYETYLEDLNNYRKRVLTEWMDGLIKEYKTPEEVIAHVRHPDLTHVLISGYVKDEDHITDHMERIALAVHRYMDGRELNVEVTNEVIDTDAQYMGEEDELGRFIYFNDDGEQVVEYADDDTKDEFETDEDDMNTLIIPRAEFENKLEPEYVFYGLGECMVDITSFYRESYKEAIHNAIIDVAEKYPGTYDLLYIFGRGVAKVGYKIAYVPDELNFAIKSAYLNSTEDIAN